MTDGYYIFTDEPDLKGAIAILTAENRQLKQKLEEIKEYITDYPNACKIKGTCIDDRLCSSCFLGSGLEVCDDILDIIEGAEDDGN